jgi:hypothetical protein
MEKRFRKFNINITGSIQMYVEEFFYEREPMLTSPPPKVGFRYVISPSLEVYLTPKCNMFVNFEIFTSENYTSYFFLFEHSLKLGR